jgi:plasmid maintenance system killer protein
LLLHEFNLNHVVNNGTARGAVYLSAAGHQDNPTCAHGMSAQERLVVLHHSTEKDLMKFHALHYHSLRGTRRYSIDADSRASKWRITFAWANRELTDVSLVKIEDTH